MLQKKRRISYRIHNFQFQNISRDRKIQSLDQKYFLQKMLKKRGGISYRIHHYQFQNISTDRKIQLLVQKNFLQKFFAKKEGGLRTEFNIPSSKYFQTQENTIPRSKIFSTKNAGKKQGVCWTEITVMIKNFRIKLQFLDPNISGDRKIQMQIKSAKILKV